MIFLMHMSMFCCFFKIERERDEHLMPRLKADSEPESDSAADKIDRKAEQELIQMEREQERQKEIEKQRELERIRAKEQEMEQELLKETVDSKLVRMQPNLKALDEQSSPAGTSPGSPDSDNAGPMSASEDSSSQQFIGPASRDDKINTKMGFSSLKFGKSFIQMAHFTFFFYFSKSEGQIVNV